MSLTVLHVCDYHLKYATSLASGMARNGHRVDLLTRDHDGEFGDEPGAMRRFVQARMTTGMRHGMLPGRMRDLSALPSVVRLKRSIRAAAPDVVHFQESVGTDLRLIVAAGVPWGRFAITVHDVRPHPGEEWPAARRWSLRALIRGAGLVFVHSEVLRETLIGEYRPDAPVVVVPHGIDAPQVRPLPAVPSLLFFGRISTYYKGLDVLLDAMPQVWRRDPRITLTIAGAGEIEAHPSLEDSRVRLLNEHIADERVPDIFADATLCVLPYREASQSGVGSRAKSYGRGLIATDTGGLPELVSDGSGRLVPVGDADALARAITDVTVDPSAAESLSRAAASATAAADWKRVAARTVDAYDSHLMPSR